MDSLLTLMPPGWPKPEREIRCRFYSGWYEETGLTLSAQQLSTDLMIQFPDLMQYSGRRVRLYADLALSLVADPPRHLFYTYRKKRAQSNLKCRELSDASCIDPSNCPLAPLPRFIKKKKCPEHGCSVKSRDLLFRAEQKLVDSMVLSDLLYLATMGEEAVGIIGSDHDLWPGIRTAVNLGVQVIQAHSKRGQLVPRHYCDGLTSGYVQGEI